MRKQIRNKLRSRSGETLAEVLVALLIIALSSMLLVVMYNTAASIDMRTRQRDRTFYEELQHAETHYVQGAAAEEGVVSITVSDESSPKHIDVTVHGGSGLTSYKVADSDRGDEG